MATPTPEGPRRTGSSADPADRTGGARGLLTETKDAYKTTEFYIYLVAVVAVLIASHLIGTSDGHNDYFRGDKAWFYVVLLTVGYLLSRGLAKAGSQRTRNGR
ncbi:MAG: hypothetical protein ACRDOO_06720 [Actinomadura sp.]